MATGFETRQGGRDSFASSGPAMTNIRQANASGESRGVQRVGGDAAAGGTNVQIPQGPITSDTAELGDFFTKMLQPYVERKQQQQFFQGFAHAQAGESIADLDKSHGTLTGKLFGPKAFEQGAIAFTALDQGNKFQQAITDKMDDWVRMTPEEQGKRLSELSTSMMTNDPNVNQLVQADIIKRTGPLLDTIAKGRFKYQQQTLSDTHYKTLSSAANNLQTLGMKASQVNDPSDPNGGKAMEAATDNFLGLLHPPEGMEVENFKGTITDFLMGTQQRGNFYAYNAAIDHGALELIGSDNADKVLAAHDRWSKVAQEAAKGNHSQEILAIHAKAKQMVKDPKTGQMVHQISPLQALAGYDAVNAKINQETGLKGRAYDSAALVAAGDSIIDMLAGEQHTQIEHQYQAGVRANERKLDQADKDADTALKMETARNSWKVGNVGTQLAQGMDATASHVAAQELYQKRDWGQLALSFNQDKTIDTPLQHTLQSKLTSAMGQAFTGEAKEAYGIWKEWSQKDLSSAVGYFGPEAPRLLTMDRMVAAGEVPSQAFLMAFAKEDIGKYPAVALSGHQIAQYKDVVASAVDSMDSSFLGRMFGGAPAAMSNSVKDLVTNETYREVGSLLEAGSHIPPEELAKAAVKSAYANGHLEVHGSNIAWINPANATPMPKLVRMNPETFRNSLTSLLDARLKQSGLAEGASGDYDINRVGNNLLVFSPTSGKIVRITPDDITKARYYRVMSDRPMKVGPDAASVASRKQHEEALRFFGKIK